MLFYSSINTRLQTIRIVTMKLFSVICVWLLVGISNVLADMADAHIAMVQAKLMSGGVGCLRDYPLSLSDIRKFRNKMMPDGERAKCFTQCLFQKIGIMDDMGKLSREGAKATAMEIFKDSDDQLKKVDMFIEKCSNVNDLHMDESGKKGCDRAKVAFMCLVENAPKFGFNVDF